MKQFGLSAAKLGAQNLARVCAFCGDPAQVCRVGSDAQYQRQTSISDGLARTVQVLVAPAIASVDLCLAHGIAHWPWQSDKVRVPGRARP